MSEPNVRPIRDSKIIRNLLSVFKQLDDMLGFATGVFDERVEQPKFDLHAFPLPNRGNPCGNLEQARHTLLRCCSQYEKGWLTREEFKNIEQKCIAAIQAFEAVR